MRDFFSYSIPLFRAFAIQVRLHLLYIIITLGMMFRFYLYSGENWIEITITMVGLLFVIILLHEFGHCFAARREGGDADKIVMWPLGGLAFCQVPHHPKAHFNTAAGGPLVNVVICIACAIPLVIGGYIPSFNPLNSAQVWSPELYNWQEGRYHVPGTHTRWFDPQKNEPVRGTALVMTSEDEGVMVSMSSSGQWETIKVKRVKMQGVPEWAVWVSRMFWLSWFLLLFNLLPAFPLDGGRLLQSMIWWRTDDYRQGTNVAVNAGYVVAVLMLILSLMWNESQLMGLAIFIIWSCYREQITLMEQEYSPYGENFGGYSSDDRDEKPVPVRRPGPLRRWLDARRAKKAAREAERRSAEDSRFDDLLQKVHREGLHSLTDEERRFMQKMSERYRNRPS